MSNVEHGAGFQPRIILDLSPMHILPVGGGPVEITQQLRRQEFKSVTVVESNNARAHGTLNYHQGKKMHVTCLDGEAIVPEDAKVDVIAYGVDEPITLHVLKEQGVVITDPNTGRISFLDEKTPPMLFPKAKPQFGVWYEKAKQEKITVNASTATKILGCIEMQRLVDDGFISAEQRHKNTALQVTPSDIIRAYMIHTVMKAHGIPLTAMRSRMITPYTEERLLYAMAQPEWNDIVVRAKEHNLDLQTEMNGLLHAARSHTNATRHPITQSYQ